ncbi:hypothetical protein OQ968_19860 [Mycobacterium sp. 663a-19]|nr:hypothetical protein [Mycobacterium sp. 663a-19]MEB3983512.1 hypothetical protein [Mycobacterium sp. 663a-19]
MSTRPSLVTGGDDVAPSPAPMGGGCREVLMWLMWLTFAAGKSD